MVTYVLVKAVTTMIIIIMATIIMGCSGVVGITGVLWIYLLVM